MRYLVVLMLLSGCLAPGGGDGPADGDDGAATAAAAGEPPELDATNPRLDGAWPTATPCPHEHAATSVEMTGVVAAAYHNGELSIHLALREATVMGADGTWTDTIALDVTGDMELTAYMDGVMRTLRIDDGHELVPGKRIAMFHQAGMPMPFGVAIADLADACVPVNGKLLQDEGRWSVTATGPTNNLETFFAYGIGGTYESAPGAWLPAAFRLYSVDDDFVPDVDSFRYGSIALPQVRPTSGWERLPFEAPWPEPDGAIGEMVPREAAEAWLTNAAQRAGDDCLKDFIIHAEADGAQRLQVVGPSAFPYDGQAYEGTFADGTYRFDEDARVDGYGCQPDRSIVGGHAAFWRMQELPLDAGGFTSFGLVLQPQVNVIAGPSVAAEYVMTFGDLLATMDAQTGLYRIVIADEADFGLA